MLHDPVLWRVLTTLTILATVIGGRALSRRFDGRTPAYRRELEATYASFRRFLITVQAVVVRRLQE
jgi:hypothetical protein